MYKFCFEMLSEKWFTDFGDVELNPHTNVVGPTFGHDSNVTSSDEWVHHVNYYCVAVNVSIEDLELSFEGKKFLIR